MSAVTVVIALVALAVMAIAAARSDWVTQAGTRSPRVEPAAPSVPTDVADRPSTPLAHDVEDRCGAIGAGARADASGRAGYRRPIAGPG